MNHTKARRLSNIISIIGVVLLLFTPLFEKVPALLVIFCAAGFIAIGVSFILIYQYYRCPHCQGVLPVRTLLIPSFCPHCGKKLDEPER